MIFKISSEIFDMCWFCKASSKERAKEMFLAYIENMGWANSLEDDEEVDCDIEEIFTKDEELVEERDM